MLDCDAADAAKALRIAREQIRIVCAGECAVAVSVVNVACAYGDADTCRYWPGFDAKWA